MKYAVIPTFFVIFSLMAQIVSGQEVSALGMQGLSYGNLSRNSKSINIKKINKDMYLEAGEHLVYSTFFNNEEIIYIVGKSENSREVFRVYKYNVVQKEKADLEWSLYGLGSVFHIRGDILYQLCSGVLYSYSVASHHLLSKVILKKQVHCNKILVDSNDNIFLEESINQHVVNGYISVFNSSGELLTEFSGILGSSQVSETGVFSIRTNKLYKFTSESGQFIECSIVSGQETVLDTTWKLRSFFVINGFYLVGYSKSTPNLIARFFFGEGSNYINRYYWAIPINGSYRLEQLLGELKENSQIKELRLVSYP